MKLLPSQKVAILEEANRLSLDSRLFDFDWNETNPDMLNIEFKGVQDQRFYFNILDSVTKYSIDSWPMLSEKRLNVTIKPEFASLLLMTSKWVNLLKKEVDADKRFSELLNPENYIPFEEISDEDEMFSKKEISALKAQSQKLIERLETLGLNEHQVNDLKEHITKSIEKAHGQSKIDWKNLFVGMILTKMFELGIESHIANQIWEGVGQFIFIGQLLLKQ